MISETEASLQGRMRAIGLVLGPLVFAVFLIAFDPVPDQPTVGRMAALAAWMAIWWLTEAVPLAVTSILPIVLFPLLNIATPAETTRQYFNPIISLFLGAFLIAIAMERWNLHRRIALKVVMVVGTQPVQLVFGFLASSAFLSMWISNTATATMMLPIALAVISRAEEKTGVEETRALSVALLLAVAYGASIGGVATLVGTPTNLAFAQIYRQTFPDAPPVNFGQWFAIGLPFSIAMLVFTGWWLSRGLARSVRADNGLESTAIRNEYKTLGPIDRDERIVLIVFVSAALMWMFRSDLSLGFATIPGWSRLWEPLSRVDDGAIAIFLACILFVMPSTKPGAGRFLLDASSLPKLPWDILLLFGGGFALASGFASTGLAVFLASVFSGAEGIPGWLVIASICLALTFLTELTSNVATVQMFLPVLAALAVAQGVPPLLYMVPATISASMAFMMPVATPPNAIVFGSHRLRIVDMARTGLVLNLAGVIVATLFATWVLPLVFGFDPSTVPAWSEK